MSAAADDLNVLTLEPDRKKAHQREYAQNDPLAELAASIAGCRRLFTPDRAFDDIAALALDWRPDLVIWDPFVYTGAVAARVSGAASARMLFGVDGHGQLRAACLAEQGLSWADELPEDPIRDWLAPILARYGQDYDAEVALGHRTIFPMPPWIWRPHGVHYLPVRHVPYHGPAVVDPWLLEPPKRDRVCITMGMSHRDEGFGAEVTAATLFEAVAGLDAEVVATLNERQLADVAHVPDNVRVVDFAPLDALLPTCAAIVHSGGAGTFAAALEHGVPQLIIPNTYFAEKWWGPLAMANGLEEQGAGLYLGDSDQVTAESLGRDLRRVLADRSFARNAGWLREELSTMPAPADVVPLLQSLAANHHG
jgi:UDP:flavonoid glycosyltransferase YjiC (YdhE family)